MKIKTHPAFFAVGITVQAPWQELWTAMPEAWQQLLARYEEIPHRVPWPLVDISLDLAGGQYLQLVGAVVNQAQAVPAGMRAVEIPSQQYIHHTHEGPVQEIAAAFGRVYAWAEEQGHEAAEFKLDFGYTAQGDEQRHELYVAVPPLPAWRFID